MEYSLSIRQDNIQAYADIEADIKAKQNGLFTFIIRVNNGKIVDYNVLEYVTAKTKYLRLKELVTEKLIVVHNFNPGTFNNAIRSDDL